VAIEPNSSIRVFRGNLGVLEREIELSMTSEADCCSVTLAKCHLLLEIQRRGHTSVTEIASAFELDKNTLSRTVDAACRAGLIERTVDPANRRQQLVRLTEKGRQTTQEIKTQRNATYVRLFDFIPREHHLSVVQTVALLAQAMQMTRRNPKGACAAESSHD
jgi:DNA-binding MarR family transcriptional regulator